MSCENAPVMERPIQVWNGAPEEIGICRMSVKDIAEATGNGEILVHRFADNKDYVCISANEVVFKTFGCMTFEDYGVLQRYIETLIDRCARWKK